jgi:hypothetical protein
MCAEMEAVLVLVTLGDLALYEISNQSHDFCPNSQFLGGTEAACVFYCFVCHNSDEWDGAVIVPCC